MECNDGGHRMLEEVELTKMIKAVIDDHAESMVKIDAELYKGDYCGSEFFSVLINAVIHIAVNAINYMIKTDAFSRTQAIDLVIGGITANIGMKSLMINEQELMGKLKSSLTTH